MCGAAGSPSAVNAGQTQAFKGRVISGHATTLADGSKTYAGPVTFRLADATFHGRATHLTQTKDGRIVIATSGRNVLHAHFGKGGLSTVLVTNGS